MPSLHYRKQVFSHAQVFLKSHILSTSQYKLYEWALQGLRTETQYEEILPFIDMPRFVCLGLTGEGDKALPLSVATTLLFLGIDILDDLADGDLPSHWTGYSPSEIHLVAATLLSSLPQMAISEMKTSASCQAALQKILAQRLLRMSAGQHQDLSMKGRNHVSFQEIVSSVEGKSGEEMALLTALAAQFSEASENLVLLYTEMGKAMGIASQFASDCYDLFQSIKSKDLANETRTLPLALYLNKNESLEKQQFLELLKKAKSGLEVTGDIRECLHDAGVLGLSAFVVELYCQKALSILKEVKPQEKATAAFKDVIKHISFFSKKGETYEYGRDREACRSMAQ